LRLRLRRIELSEVLFLLAWLGILVALPWTVIVLLWRRRRWTGVAGFVAWLAFAAWFVDALLDRLGEH
jgi:hypothetical protein